MGVGVVGHHLRKPQRLAPVAGHGCAHDPGGVGDEKGHPRCGHRFRGDQQIALVLAVFVVDHHDHAAGSERGNGTLHRFDRKILRLRRKRVRHQMVSVNAEWVPKRREWYVSGAPP